MGIISYTTDLHVFKPSTGRIRNLCNRIIKLPKKPKALIFGGDTFGVKHELFMAYMKNPMSDRIRNEIKNVQKKLVHEEFLPEIKNLHKKLPELKIFISPGNADYDAYTYIKSNPALFPMIHCIDLEVIPFEGLFIIGMGGIITDPGNDCWGITKNDDGGFITRSQRKKILSKIENLVAGSWDKVIFVSHRPAYGHIDYYKNNELTGKPMHEGEKIIYKFIKRKKPLIHLTGHVHGAPEMSGTFSIIGKHTISVNPGGDHMHDPEIKAVLIDIGKLRLYRNKNVITSDQAENIIRSF